MKKNIEKELKKPIWVLKWGVKREFDEEDSKKEKKESIKEKKILVVIEKGKIFTFRDEKIDDYIDELPEDYNVNYVIENDDTVVINKDYKEIWPYVKYLLWNVYESLEMRAIKKNRAFGIWFLILILIVLGLISFFINSWTYTRLETMENNIKNYCSVWDPGEPIDPGEQEKNEILNIEEIEKNIENNKWSWEF